ncbi:MAG: ferrous iron transporter B, partial [Firmicutes bacterium HGW-Firmicutes-20]
MRIALAGNPNSGKTTLFNAITGSIESVGNWPGVTVARKEGEVKRSLYKKDESIRIIDLPGTYSMSPFTLEERITRDFVKNENPDVIINIIDSNNLSRSLVYTTQLLELGVPIVVALNKWDMIKSKLTEINVDTLSKQLNCPVIPISAIQNQGLRILVETCYQIKGKKQIAPYHSTLVENLDEVAQSDKQRFEFVSAMVTEAEKRTVNSDKQTIHDAIDRIVANRYLGMPIFALVLYSVFAISQSTIGPLIADYLVAWIDNVYLFAESLMEGAVSPLLQTLLLDGIIGGVGAIVGFLPLIMVLFFMLALLEDSGYMARVAFIMDRIFR